MPTKHSDSLQILTTDIQSSLFIYAQAHKQRAKAAQVNTHPPRLYWYAGLAEACDSAGLALPAAEGGHRDVAKVGCGPRAEQRKGIAQKGAERRKAHALGAWLYEQQGLHRNTFRD